MSEKKTVSVRDIESLLVCLPGIQKARVVVNDWGAIEEIHILTGLGRNPKQIVRDVQSALKAQWDITVDRRKVSVAQVQTSLPAQPGRIRYVGIEVKTNARTGKSEIAVTLDRAIEKQTAVYVGRAVTDSSEVAMLLGVARATCLAANLTLTPPNAFFVDDVTTLTIGERSAVAVLVDLLTPRRNHEQLVGCALVKRDIREACVRATLDAMNRRLEVLPPRPISSGAMESADGDSKRVVPVAAPPEDRPGQMELPDLKPFDKTDDGAPPDRPGPPKPETEPGDRS
ncbi:MAG: hypothetical protein ACOX5Q_00205 [Bacillota bacterium]|nr:hypothetical protein [Candidatus Fermentithermobacillaceae bacterium]